MLLHHPPWTRLGCVRRRLHGLCRRVAERLVRLIGDSLGKAARDAVEAFLLGRPATQPYDPLTGEPLGSHEFDDGFEAEMPAEDPVPMKSTPRPQPVSAPAEQPAPRPQPLWQRLGLAGLRALTWVAFDLPRRRPLPATLALVAVTVLSIWVGPVAGLIGAGLGLFGLT